MTLTACVDNKLGLQFNGRRQSQDHILRERLLSLVDTRLFMRPYSGKMFEFSKKIVITEDYLAAAGADDWVFAEDTEYLPYAQKIDRIVLFHWNRDYPGDTYFAFPGQWKLTHQEEFTGNSHEKITMEIYHK